MADIFPPDDHNVPELLKLAEASRQAVEAVLRPRRLWRLGDLGEQRTHYAVPLEHRL